MRHIAVLLAVHNRKEKTLMCLSALYNCLLPEKYRIDVFLVDDKCTDGTTEAIKKQFSQVKIIQGSGNLFWNRGMCLAWKTAATYYDYDYYLWLNDDTILYSSAIQELVICSESEDNQNIICSATCATNDQNKITYGGRVLKGGIVIPNGQKQYCDYFHGNIVLIPRKVYSVVGANDPVFHHAFGDFDYGLRARKLGVRSVVTPHIEGTCDVHETFAAWCNPATPVMKRFKLLYTPLGNHPGESFIYENRHLGLLKACFHYCTNYLRVLCPVLWKNRSL